MFAREGFIIAILLSIKNFPFLICNKVGVVSSAIALWENAVVNH